MVPADASKRYRPDIDGLRALAVTVVVLFHAEVPGFSGGYVGVDVFFVISGFLITGILARSFSEGNFSVSGFYERRARRILPALFAMVLAVLASAPFFIRPWDLSVIGRSVRYVSTSVANIDFYRKLSDYFGDDANFVTFLHTWSLSVEEQFYIVIPLLWLLLTRLTSNPANWLRMFIGVAVVSFLLTVWVLPRDQSACFFLLPYRAWELAAGGILALAPVPVMTRITSQLAGILGIGMILAATFFLDHDTLFPGAWALVPCLGAILIILSGMGGVSTVSKLILSSRPFVFVGLISYSLYLVHWPVLVFFRYQKKYSLAGDTLWWETLFLLCLIFLLGWLSWRYVETPFRRSGFWTRRRIFVFAWSGIAALFAIGIFYQRTSLFLKLLPDEARDYSEVRHSNYRDLNQVLSSREADNPLKFGYADAEADIAIWGDSHGAALVTSLSEEAVRSNQSFYFFGKRGTLPLTGVVCAPGIKGISRAGYSNDVYDRLISDKSIRKVILSARWTSYTEGGTSMYGPAEKSKLGNGFILLPGDPPPGSIEVRTALAEALERTVNGLLEAGKMVYLVYPIPELGYNIPEVLANEVIEGRDPNKFIISASGIYHERTAETIAILDGLPNSSKLIRIRPEEKLIKDGIIQFSHEGKLLYCDDDHLSLDGGRYIMSLFDQVF